MGFVRLVVIGFVLMSVVYFSVSLYSRSVRREKLENRWAESHPGGETEGRDAYVQEGMEEYEKGFRKKLIFLVYIIPTAAIIATLYLTNAN